MNEKVKLPKAVCDLLDKALDNGTDKAAIVEMINRKKYRHIETMILNEQDADEIMRALVLGYEPELTAEELTKEVYFLKYETEAIPETMEEAFQEGVKTALHIHGIHYEWLVK